MIALSNDRVLYHFYGQLYRRKYYILDALLCFLLVELRWYIKNVMVDQKIERVSLKLQMLHS